MTSRYGRELADRLMKRRAELEAAVSGIAKTDAARRAVLFFLVGCMALDWDGLSFTEAAGYRAGATVTGPGFAYTENAPEISRRGLYWGSHNRAVGSHTFSTFGDHEALPRAALPDPFFSRATTPSSSLADLSRILLALHDGATTAQRMAAVAQVRAPELTSALALLESIKYVERDQNGGYRLRITVLGENAAPAAARVVAIVREEMAAWHKERAADAERAFRR